jgi:hypothetical protein
MGQFKPMVKMETTEPSVELKLAKGGHVNMKKGGKAEAGHKKMAGGGMSAMGALAGTPALIGRPAVNAPVMAPGKPSMAMRRKAMMARPMPAPMAPAMKNGGKSDMAEDMKMDKAQDKAMIKKAFKQHDSQEHKGGKGTELKLKKGGKYATGGVIDGQGGYAKGGIINTEGQGGKYRDTLMHTAKPDNSPAKTGGVKDGNGGGYKTGGVAKSNAGGFKKGGATKKHFATGGSVNTGHAVAMPQGRKPAPSPVAINQLAGTYKRGGSVTPAEGRLLKNNATENAASMRAAKADSNLKYSKYQKMADGGPSGQGSVTNKERKTLEDLSGGAYDKTNKVNRDLEEALNPLSMVKELVGKARNAFSGQGSISDKERAVPAGSVTKTEKSVTMTPSRKRGGSVNC